MVINLYNINVHFAKSKAYFVEYISLLLFNLELLDNCVSFRLGCTIICKSDSWSIFLSTIPFTILETSRGVELGVIMSQSSGRARKIFLTMIAARMRWSGI